ncbi:hypothetical protein EZV62_015020 [Acer yangbiense]|uniref:Uncharacterized protein n=1 Tax=Acer yangbiense TaxID=1000413 RepID=A0A5C7GPA4_9ROSI|nr:hypothetical protein EZV62_028051 [Acer yangbiense]TXG60447.1 hypothetical protein EZV62_015020 [Acer yangbiense]
MDVVETSEPTNVKRQQPYMIGFDNNLYMSLDMHLGGGLLDESQKEMMEEVDAVEDDKITTIFSKEIQALESRMMQNFNMIRKEKEANSEPPMYTYTGYERKVEINESTKHGDLPDETKNLLEGEERSLSQIQGWSGSGTEEIPILVESNMVPLLTKRSKHGQKSLDVNEYSNFLAEQKPNYCNVGNLKSESQNFFKQIEDRWSWMSCEILLITEWKKIQPCLRRPL